jgi:hypothetical protein
MQPFQLSDGSSELAMTELGGALWQAVEYGRVRHLKLATAHDLNGFQGEPFKCHENGERWAATHPGSQVVRGWLITAQNIFVKHSVVETPDGTLLDVTPRVGSDAQHPTGFIIWETGSAEDFASLPPQVIYVPPHWLEASNGAP